MKVIIQQGAIKRVIEGPFRICLSNADANTLCGCLGGMAESGTYGWVDIVESPKDCMPESSPLPWIDGTVWTVRRE